VDHAASIACECRHLHVAVTRRTTPGGAGPKPVADQLRNLRRRLEIDGERVGRD